MDSRAQASVEYLVLLATVLALVMVVAFVIMQMGGGQKAAVNESTQALNESIRRL